MGAPTVTHHRNPERKVCVVCGSAFATTWYRAYDPDQGGTDWIR